MCLGIPGQVVEIVEPDSLIGVVDVSGVRRKVNLACVAGEGPLESLVGEWVLVHVGFAMSRIDPEEAAETLRALEELGEAMEEIERIRAAEEMMSGEPQEARS